MRVTVRLGEPLCREIGQREIEIALPESASIADLLEVLADTHPALRPWLDGEEVPPTIFLDEKVADPATPLHDGARPMVSWALAGG